MEDRPLSPNVSQGIEVSARFTANINADLRVGSLEETITVSGATPLVDTQNVRRQTIASRELLDALPTSTKHINTLVTLTPGFTGVTDVGGRYFAEAGAYHGKRGTKVYFDGMGIEDPPIGPARAAMAELKRPPCATRAAATSLERLPRLLCRAAAVFSSTRTAVRRVVLSSVAPWLSSGRPPLAA